MISKKIFVADGSNTRFLSDFIIRSEQFCRVYTYMYDINGVDGDVDANGLYIRVTDFPKSEDLVTIDNWDLVDNSISYYVAPPSGASVYIEVATTAEEFGSTITQPSVERAEIAADAAELSATNASASELAAATSETNASASELAAATSETNASASELAAATSEANAASSETNAASSETNAEAALQSLIDTDYGIERGENINGGYVKYPDGTLICFDVRSVLVGAAWTYPMPFITSPGGYAIPPIVTISPIISTLGTAQIAVLNSVSLTGATMSTYTTGEVAINTTCNVMAVGYWK